MSKRYIYNLSGRGVNSNTYFQFKLENWVFFIEAQIYDASFVMAGLGMGCPGGGGGGACAGSDAKCIDWL